jgi:hypothetical protein
MNPPTEFDRVLGEWLLDGPNRAPEHAVDVALAHARSHPRRLDPLRPFRRDAMPARERLVLLPRLGLVFAILALVLAGIAVAVMGSRPPNDKVLPPGPSVSTSPSASTSPAPTFTPPAASRSPFFAAFALIVTGGSSHTAQVTDVTSDLVEAISGTPNEGVSVDTGAVQIALDPADDHILVITWSGGPCEAFTAIRVDETARFIDIQPSRCEGDATAHDRIVRLRFASAVDAGAWTGRVVAAPAPSGPGPS